MRKVVAISSHFLFLKITKQDVPDPSFVEDFMKLPPMSLKLAFLLTFTLLTTATAHSQRRSGESTSDKGGKPRIVVLATGSNSTMWTTNVATATLEDVITQSGRFELIAGAQREQLFKEQGFNNSQLVD